VVRFDFAFAIARCASKAFACPGNRTEIRPFHGLFWRRVEAPHNATRPGGSMNDMLRWSGRLAGIAGVLLCVLAGATRLSGHYWLGSFQVGTVLVGGIAVMMIGCVCMLWVLVSRTDPPS